ncbi:MAG: VCBS repeat-containing protein [Planctomycetia bacterium]|nr:VCBS repeat-containing protein [Planctomycetia bacterium]
MSLAPNVPARAVRADFNNDGKPDVVTVNPGQDTVSVLIGDAAGHLTLLGSFAAGDDPQGLAVADLNGDGFPEVVVTNRAADTVSVLVNAAGTSLGAPTALAAPDEPVAVVAGSLDAGATVDLVVVSATQTTASFYAGNGNATFAAGAPFATVAPSADAALGNVDGDADLDLVLLSLAGIVDVRLNNGSGGFPAPSPHPVAAGDGRIAVVQVAGTAAPDLVCTNQTTGAMTVFVNEGAGAFSSAAIPTAVGGGPLGFTTADVDGDTFVDVIVACGAADAVRILPGNGDGTFDAALLENVGLAPNTPVAGAFGPGLGVAVTLGGDAAVYLMLK